MHLSCGSYMLTVLHGAKGSSLPLMATVGQLMDRLIAAGVGERPVIFVCHRCATVLELQHGYPPDAACHLTSVQPPASPQSGTRRSFKPTMAIVALTWTFLWTLEWQ